MEFGFQMIETEVGLGRKPLVLDFTPEDFDEVEFGTTGWQPVQADALAEPVQDAGLKCAAGMDGGVVEDNQAEFLGAGGLGGKGVQGGDDGGRGDAAGDGVKRALVGGAHESQDIHAGAGGARNGASPPARLPGMGDGGRQTEAALVEIKHLDHPARMALPQRRQAGVRRAKGSLVARPLDPSPTPFPPVVFFLMIRCTVWRLACLPVACSNWACARLTWRGSSSSQPHNRASSTGV